MDEEISKSTSNIGVNNFNQKITLNVSGTRFVTTQRTLLRFPNTKLGNMARIQGSKSKSGQQFFFDADEIIFREVLRYHRTGEMHVPSNVCHKMFYKQLTYWGISKEVIEECCTDVEIDDMVLERQFLWFEKRFEPRGDTLTWSEHVWYFLTDPRGPYTQWKKASTAWTFLYMIMTIIQTLNLAIFTLPTFSVMDKPGNLSAAKQISAVINEPCVGLANIWHTESFVDIWALERFLFLFFFVEIIIRSACCPNKSLMYSGFSINLLDLVISFCELVSVVLLQGMEVLDCVPNDKGYCRAVLVLLLVGVMIVQLRCHRLLTYATVFR